MACSASGKYAHEAEAGFQVSLRDTVVFMGRTFPPVELAGYFHWSLRDQCIA